MKKDTEFPIMTSTNGNDNGNGNDNDDNKVQVFELPDQKDFCGQLLELIKQIPPDMQPLYEFSAAAQGASVKIPCSGTGMIEVSAPKFQILISPVKKKDH